MDPALVELFNASREGGEIEVIARLRRAHELPPNLRPISWFGDIVTGRVVREQLKPVWSHDCVESLKAPRTYCREDLLELETSSDVEPWPGDGRCRSTTLASARNVVVGICDWGLDFAHDDFRNPDGSTRVLALWDQSSREGKAPEPYGYGRVIHRAEIDVALRSSDPYATLGYRAAAIPGGTHGTHVTGIAAGNGRAPGSIRSAAHEADIVFVHLHAGRAAALENLGDSVRLLEAIDFIRCVAGDRPWVCNCSLGRTGGPHDGSTLVEQGIDALLQQPGCAVVMSAGNYFAHHSASFGPLRVGQTTSLGWCVSEADRTQNELEIWYSSQDDVVVRMRAPDGSTVATASLGETARISYEGRECGRLYHRACDPNNGDHHVDIFLDPIGPGGNWRVELTPVSVQNGRYYAWIERDPGPAGTQSTFSPEVVSTECTTGTICNGKYSIAVGAIDAHAPELPLGWFSSGGRLRSGRCKPDLVAPGVQVLSACSAEGDFSVTASAQVRKSGTSMAAPHVTAAIAAMLQVAKRPLRIDETRRILFETTHPIDSHGNAARVGAGLMDLERAIRMARDGMRLDSTAAVTHVAPSRRSSSETPLNWSNVETVWLPLSSSVGPGAQNEESDVHLIQRRLIELGLLRPEDAENDRSGLFSRRSSRTIFTEQALAQFQERLRSPHEAVIAPGSTTHRLLMRPNLPAARPLHLTQPVGEGAAANREDRRVRARLLELGFGDATTPLPDAIACFQKQLMQEVTGRLLPGSLDERVLSDPTFGTLSTFAQLEAASSSSRDTSSAFLQQASWRCNRRESLVGFAPEAGLPLLFGRSGLDGPRALGALARLRGRVETNLSPDEVEQLAWRATRIGALFDELQRIHLPSDSRTPLREVARSLIHAFDAELQQKLGLFPADLLRMLRAQRGAHADDGTFSSTSYRSERLAFQTKGLLTGLQGQALRDAMTGSLSDVLIVERLGQSTGMRRGVLGSGPSDGEAPMLL